MKSQVKQLNGEGKWKLMLYWFVVGVCVGLGAITIFSIGIALALLGLGLALYAVKQGWLEGLWAALLGLGLAPALLLTYENGNSSVAFAFWAIALAGVLWGMANLFMRRRTS